MWDLFLRVREDEVWGDEMDDAADPGTVNDAVTGEADMAVDAVCGVCADIGFVEDRTGGRTEPF